MACRVRGQARAASRRCNGNTHCQFWVQTGWKRLSCSVSTIHEPRLGVARHDGCQDLSQTRQQQCQRGFPNVHKYLPARPTSFIHRPLFAQPIAFAGGPVVIGRVRLTSRQTGMAGSGRLRGVLLGTLRPACKDPWTERLGPSNETVPRSISVALLPPGGGSMSINMS